MQIVDPDRHTTRLMTQMKADLRLHEEPRHIECFDNSNLQGSNPVAACVVFRDGKPYKKDYRHYNIKTVVGPDDFASMEEVVYRRYKRLQGRGRIAAAAHHHRRGKGTAFFSALKSLDRLGLRGKIAIVGIAKRLEEIYFPRPYSALSGQKSESLKVIQYLRNEAHVLELPSTATNVAKARFVQD